MEEDIITRKKRITAEFLKHHKRTPNIDNPQSFSEKIQFRKLYDRDPRLPRLGGKIDVRSYVAEVAGSDLIVPVVWSGTELPSRQQRGWAIPYVLKASHGSGWNIFVTADQRQDWPQIELTTRQWLSQVYGQRQCEWLYSCIPPRLLVEAYIGTKRALPIDYKVLVFDGKAHYVQAISKRMVRLHVSTYDRNWVQQPVKYVRFPVEQVPPPKCLDRMLAIAERLGAGLSFVRVDFYEVGGQLKVSEMTFYPTSGYHPFEPESFDRTLGELWPHQQICAKGL
jgi:hypothetical protein